MYVVSGVSRSGTSLMMDCLRKAFGKERIYGVKFPDQERIERMDKQGPEEPDHLFQCRMYLNKDRIKKEQEKYKRSMDLNPQGFWESPYAVQGVYYRFEDRENLIRWQTEEKPTICKIVCRGLWQSDPSYIDKIIYMIRHPRAVAKSQERLERDMPEIVDEFGNEHRLADELKVHTPKMYIDVTARACMWLVEYPHVPILHVYYDELIEKPKETFEKIRNFLGEGDFTKAVKSIKPKLRRSEPEDIPNTLWETAEEVYRLFAEEDYQGVLDYLMEITVDRNEGLSRWLCPRMGRVVFENECKACVQPGGAMTAFRATAEAHKMPWRSEPCLYECGFGPGPYKTIEESIKNNSWGR